MRKFRHELKDDTVTTTLDWWDTNDYWTLHKWSGQEVITGSGKAGKIRAIRMAKGNTRYFRLTHTSGKDQCHYNIDGSISY